MASTMGDASRLLYIGRSVCKCQRMAGLTLARRDLAETRKQLHRWFERELDRQIHHCELSQANASIGWSSESLLFSVDPDDAGRVRAARSRARASQSA